MKRSQLFFFYLLGAYVVLQFSWWAYHLIQLTRETGAAEIQVQKRIWMIIGEGLVFFMILLFGIWRMVRSMKKEHRLAQRQQNFLLSVTHELKTPIAATKLYLQTLKKREFDREKQEQMLTQAIQENERLDELVEAVLISARIENRTVSLHPETLDLVRMLEELREKYQLRLGKEWIQLKTPEKMELRSDPFILKTILINLIENALKYAGTEKALEVSVERAEEQIKIRVADQGPGIPGDQLHRVFEKFTRLENEETRSKKGTGLGLFIVREFVRLAGGKINYVPNVPKGAIFEIVL
ncbi:MAG: HAMP domain-containing histidine kinase [Bacteroidetes bacterium]|nr:MAG: HAMP domain-containing histidine kinase [Bacteroidota bacterium]